MEPLIRSPSCLRLKYDFWTVPSFRDDSTTQFPVTSAAKQEAPRSKERNSCFINSVRSRIMLFRQQTVREAPASVGRNWQARFCRFKRDWRTLHQPLVLFQYRKIEVHVLKYVLRA